MSETHYWLEAGELRMSRPESRGPCIPYLTQIDGVDRLCVIGPGGFHVFEIAPAAVARLGHDAMARFLRQEQEASKASLRWPVVQVLTDPRNGGGQP